MTIYQTIRRLVNGDGLAPEVAAQKALDGMTRAELVEFVLPEIERLARSVDRARVRSAEHRAIPLRSAPSNPEAVAALVAESFLVPDKGMVPWGEATVADHRARAKWQRSGAADLIEDAERHEAAAELIRSRRGARCLNDIDGWSDLIRRDAA